MAKYINLEDNDYLFCPHRGAKIDLKDGEDG